MINWSVSVALAPMMFSHSVLRFPYVYVSNFPAVPITKDQVRAVESISQDTGIELLSRAAVHGRAFKP